MTPLILLDQPGNFVGAFGSAGGNILAYVAKSMVAAIDWNLGAGRWPSQTSSPVESGSTAR
jgi:gamma-glutamyltranspeptidase/glutathione hydrolase